MQVPITKSGFIKAKEKLQKLKTEDRPQVIKEIAEARAHGDLSENAEYDAAKEKQAQIEAMIRHLESSIAHARVIDVSSLSGDKVVFGAAVTYFCHDDDKSYTWSIVGDIEADLQQKKISISSPIAKALIGKYLGDEVSIKTPGGLKECEITSIEFITD